MKSTNEISLEIIRSIIVPICEHISKTRDINISADEILKEISENEVDYLELYHFIDFVKRNVLAIKIAFRCDRVATWEILGGFLKQLETIGGFSHKYNKMTDAIACDLKGKGKSNHLIGLDERIENILKTADKLKEEIERDYKKRLKDVSRKKNRMDVRLL